MVSKRQPKAIDPEKMKMYEPVVAKIKEMYINKSFNNDQKFHDALVEQYGEVVDKTNFQILSTIRYDPLLASPSTFFDGYLLNPGEVIDYANMFEITPNPTKENDYNSSLFFLLNEHLDRINFTASFFGIPFHVERVPLLLNLNNALEGLDKSLPYRLRVLMNPTGDISVESYSTNERFNLFDGLTAPSLEDYLSGGSIEWKVHIDKQATMISPFTSFKTTNRASYNAARERCLPANIPPGEQHEVLLYNSANQVTEGSITNMAFKLYNNESARFEWFTPSLSSGCLCGVMRHTLLSKGLLKERLITLKEIKVGDEVLLMNGVQGVVRGRIV